MHLRTSQILELLEEDRTRYIEHDAGYYRMKEMNGDAVTVSENGELFAVDPDQTDMDDLVDIRNWSVTVPGTDYRRHSLPRT